MFSAIGDIPSVSPKVGEINSINVDYNKGGDFFSETAVVDPAIVKDGQLTINTSAYDTTKQDLTVAVCVGGTPVFVSDGTPRTQYTYNITPKYYIAITSAQVGTVISSVAITAKQLIEFKNTTSITATIDSDFNWSFWWALCNWL